MIDVSKDDAVLRAARIWSEWRLGQCDADELSAAEFALIEAVKAHDRAVEIPRRPETP